MAERPRVGVTGPDRGGLVAWLMTALALRRNGAKPVRITPGRPCDESLLDAVVIGGGSDVDPFHYGEDRLWEKSHRLARERTKPLDGLKVATFYGCTLIRPESVAINGPTPEIFEEFLRALGAEVVLAEPALLLIEWPERGAGWLPPTARTTWPSRCTRRTMRGEAP